SPSPSPDQPLVIFAPLGVRGRGLAHHLLCLVGIDTVLSNVLNVPFIPPKLHPASPRGRVVYAARSTTIATALPPPRHSAASPRSSPRRPSAYSSVTSPRVPDAPIGCPSAIAPPLTFTRASSSPSSLPHASICAANASFSSNRSMSFSPTPALS